MSPNAALGEGDRLPAVALIDHAGQRWSIEDQLGRPLVLILHRHLA